MEWESQTPSLAFSVGDLNGARSTEVTMLLLLCNLDELRRQSRSEEKGAYRERNPFI